ncbi:MAG: hypothetical protein LBB61_09025, partial [Treponema sp.]|nr:hypothetical protein [Treponema sp.]
MTESTDSAAKSTDSIAKSTDSVTKSTDSAAKSTDSVTESTDSTAKPTGFMTALFYDRVINGLFYLWRRNNMTHYKHWLSGGRDDQ